MGTFIGHLIPGSFFLTLGLWWTFNIFKRYYSSKTHESGAYANSCFFLWRRSVPVDECFILLMCFLGISMELLANYPNIYMKNQQHIALYLCYGLTAVVSLLERRKSWVPVSTSYVLWGLAAAIEGLLMYFHTHRGVAPIEALMHTITYLITWTTSVCIFLELGNSKSILAALARAYAFILHGVWFTHGAYLIYEDLGTNAEVIKASESQVMMMPVYFVYDCVLTVIVVLGIGMIQYRRVISKVSFEELNSVLADKQSEDTLLECYPRNPF